MKIANLCQECSNNVMLQLLSHKVNTQTVAEYSSGARIAELEIAVQTACDLLNGCLEWDNGGERAYEKIVEFINKHDRNVGEKKS